MPYAFISYVRNNKRLVQRLCDELTNHGANVWLDRNDIALGVDWQQAIRRAIQDGAFFIACFSKEYNERPTKPPYKTVMNEELTLAIDELRLRPTDESWFIPVKLNRCRIPDRAIGAGRTLHNIQHFELYKDWDAGVQSIIDVIQPIPADVQRLVEALYSGSGAVCIAATKALGEIANSATVSALIKVLNDEDSYVCGLAVSALANIGKPAVLALIEALEHPLPNVRVSAASALDDIGDSRAVPALTEALEDDYSSVRINAAFALGKIGDPKAIPVLIEALEHPLPHVRVSAASALGKIGDHKALSVLTEALKHKDVIVRINAASALRKIGTPEALKALGMHCPLTC